RGPDPAGDLPDPRQAGLHRRRPPDPRTQAPPRPRPRRPMTSVFHDAAPRYGCLECREDAELVVCDRLHSEGLARYHAHLRGCDACRRAHQLLAALYRGPDPASSGPGMVARDREFSAILRKVRAATPVPWYRQQVSLVGVAALAAVVAL